MIFKTPSPIQEIKLNINNPNQVKLYIKRNLLNWKKVLKIWKIY